jgi:hypothetical protein
MFEIFKSYAKLNDSHLKIIACILMLIDHIGLVFYPNVLLLRYIGRLSFPIFAYLLVRGESKTSNFWMYFARLLSLALITQPVYYFLFRGGYNIVFTLSLALLCLRLTTYFGWRSFGFWVGAAAIAQIVGLDYGLFGIVCVYLFKLFKPTFLWWLLWVAAVFVSYQLVSRFQFYCAFSPLLFYFGNGEKGSSSPWFYIFYPLHLSVLYYINLL